MENFSLSRGCFILENTNNNNKYKAQVYTSNCHNANRRLIHHDNHPHNTERESLSVGIGLSLSLLVTVIKRADIYNQKKKVTQEQFFFPSKKRRKKEFIVVVEMGWFV
jgi:hypothetical protein